MESMECDSDRYQAHGDDSIHISPMQHSGWNLDNKSLPSKHAISAVQPSPNMPPVHQYPDQDALSEVTTAFHPPFSPSVFGTPDSRWNKRPDQDALSEVPTAFHSPFSPSVFRTPESRWNKRPDQDALSEVPTAFHSPFSPSDFRTPESRWNKCQDVLSTASSFSGFRLAQNTTSPRDDDQSLDQLSDGEAGSPTRREPADRLDSELPQPTAAQSQMTKPLIPRDVTTFNSNIEPVSVEDTPERKKTSQRHSLPFNSPFQASPKRLSVGPVGTRYERSSNVSHLSRNPHANSLTASPLRSLCKPNTSKGDNAKLEPGDVPTKPSTKQTMITFKSFLVLNIVIGACVSVYALKMLLPGCGDIRNFDPKTLTKELHLNVYGQHLAVETIPHLLDDYFSKVKHGQAYKPLVLSLHGWTGVGKNFVSRIVSDFIPVSSIATFLVPLHFGHTAQNDIYAQQIPEWIVTNITEKCVNIIIFDEMDKAGDGVIHGLNETITLLIGRNLTTTPIIFLLLSNSRGAEINKFVFEKLSTGHSRSSLSLADLAHIFEGSSLLWYNDLERVIDAFVPFLPLEKTHVMQCIKKDMLLKALDVDKEMVKEVLKEMSFFKTKSGKEFSHTGCKRVSDKVNLIHHFEE